MPFEFQELDIPDIILIKPKKFGDDRGFFMETYKESDFVEAGIDVTFVQDNHSRSNKGVIRGLHYQLNPTPQGKLVRVVRGKLFDVAVDIRQGSPTFGQWVGEVLSEKNNHMLWVPPGFAHGVCILEDNTELLYKVSHSEYSPENEDGLAWNDPTLGINWPINKPILSEKDQNWPGLKEINTNFSYS